MTYRRMLGMVLLISASLFFFFFIFFRMLKFLVKYLANLCIACWTKDGFVFVNFLVLFLSSIILEYLD